VWKIGHGREPVGGMTHRGNNNIICMIGNCGREECIHNGWRLVFGNAVHEKIRKSIRHPDRHRKIIERQREGVWR
jgi:hypothetical protein